MPTFYNVIAVGGLATAIVAAGATFALAATSATSGSVSLKREGATFSGSYVFYPSGTNHGGMGYPGKICDTESDGDSAYVQAQAEGYGFGGRVETSHGNGTCVSENNYVYAPDEVYTEQGRIQACVDISFYPDPCKTSGVYTR